MEAILTDGIGAELVRRSVGRVSRPSRRRIKMIDFFGWNVGIGWIGLLLLGGGAILIGALAQFIGETRTGYEWLVAGVAALAGGWIASEAFGTLSTWGPSVEGLYLLPALIGGVLLGGLIDVVVRTMTGGSYVHHPRPI
jgi:uncharacterized membrane protein YeaQ/YmgE (transglycosylase-associated protein family)